MAKNCSVDILEDLSRTFREKGSRHWLEPLNGVGATSVRGYIKYFLVKKWCILCGTNSAICLGQSCMGKKLKPSESDPKSFLCNSDSKALPGLVKGVNVTPATTLLKQVSTVVPRQKIASLKYPCHFPKTRIIVKSNSLETTKNKVMFLF